MEEEESISSSRTNTAFHGANHSYDDDNHGHQHQSPPAPPAAATATASSSHLEDADDSGWTAYFLQLASDEEEDDAPASWNWKKQPRDVGSGCASASTVSKPIKDKDNKQQAVNKVLKKTKEVLHLVSATRIIVEEEEDPLQDTASSPLLIGATKYKRTPAGS